MDEAKEIAGEELVTRVIAAQYVDSNELVKTLRPMIPQYGNIAAITNPNVVIISDHAENVVRLMKLIEKIDVPGDERVVVVPLKDAWVGNIVELLQKLAPEQLGSTAKGPQSIQIIANERNNSLVLRGKTRPLAEIQKLIARTRPAGQRNRRDAGHLPVARRREERRRNPSRAGRRRSRTPAAAVAAAGRWRRRRSGCRVGFADQAEHSGRRNA